MHTIGIDLGTTRSRVALLDERGRPERMENAEGELITPSVVYFGDEEVMVGDRAVAAGQKHPERVVRNAKRWLGDPEKSWEIDGAVYSPVDISAIILRKLKHDVEQARGPVGRAVIGVPAHFDAQCRQLTLDAARQAGLARPDLVNEPVASALMFVLGEAIGYEELADDQTLLVYDLGGGTFDLSLVEYQKTSIRVLASTGDLKLGGIDWNERLIEQLAQRFARVHGTDFRRDQRFLLGMDQRAENAKRILSGQTTTTVGVNYRGRAQKSVVTRDEFEEWTRDLVARTEVLTTQMLSDVGTRLEEIGNLLVVGGASRMPMIRDLIRKMRKKFLDPWSNPDYDPSRKLNPEFAVAQGA